jgi:hypothetical protein
MARKSSFEESFHKARTVTCPTCAAAPFKPCRTEDGSVIRGWHPERRRAGKGEPPTEIDDLVRRSSLGTREAQDIAALTPDSVVEEILRRAREQRER